MRSATCSAPLLLAALLCSGLMTSGCRLDGIETIQAPKTRPHKKASPTSPQKAPEKPTVGSGGPSGRETRVSCPDVPAAAYEALAKPTALPDRDAPLDQQGAKKWVEALEGQVGWLKVQLGDTINKYSQCVSAVRP